MSHARHTRAISQPRAPWLSPACLHVLQNRSRGTWLGLPLCETRNTVSAPRLATQSFRSHSLHSRRSICHTGTVGDTGAGKLIEDHHHFVLLRFLLFILLLMMTEYHSIKLTLRLLLFSYSGDIMEEDCMSIAYFRFDTNTHAISFPQGPSSRLVRRQ